MGAVAPGTTIARAGLLTYDRFLTIRSSDVAGRLRPGLPAGVQRHRRRPGRSGGDRGSGYAGFRSRAQSDQPADDDVAQVASELLPPDPPLRARSAPRRFRRPRL